MKGVFSSVIRITLLIVFVLLCLCACAAKDPTVAQLGSQPKETQPSATTKPSVTTPTTVPTEPDMPVELAFVAKYVSVGQYLEIEYPVVSLIRSVDELQAHCAAYSIFCKQNVFQNAIVGYDEAFFAEKTLILILKYEGTISVSHEVTGVTQVEKDQVTVAVDRQCPEAGSDAIAIWYFFVEVEGTLASGTEVDVVWTNVEKQYPMRPR